MSFDTTYTADATHGTRQGPDWANVIVLPAMLIAASAMGVASYLHLGVSAELAVAVGLSLFCLMLLCHVLLRAADAADQEAEAAAERGTAQVASPLPAPKRRGQRPIPQMKASAGAKLQAAESSKRSRPTLASTSATGSLADAAPPPVTDQASIHATSAGAAAPHTPAAAPLARQIESIRPSDAKNAAGTAARPKGWTYRPVDPELPNLQPPPLSETANLSVGGDLQAAEPGPQPRAEAARIDAILSRLAAQIREGAKLAEVANVANQTAEADEKINAAAAASGDGALSNAVDALRSTVEAMRSGVRSASSDNTAPPPAVTAAEARLAAVAEALAAERADVFLEPILALADERANHFEVSVRLKATSGEELDARALVGVAGGAGLLPLLDALGVRHAAGFALRLERRGREGAVFSTIDGRSLESDQFVSEVAGRHAQGISDRLVLTFLQAEMRGLGPAQLAALGDLGQLGFRFALQGVSDLDMDFEALRALGFEFVKLEAEVFLKGLRCGNEDVPASDLCRYFADLGLAVIVSSIDDQSLHQRVIGCGVVFGQGRLFGGPRPIPVATSESNIAA